MPCLIFLREAERDESRMVSSLCMRRNMINHAPTAGAWQLVLWHKNVKKRSQKRSIKMLQLA